MPASCISKIPICRPNYVHFKAFDILNPVVYFTLVVYYTLVSDTLSPVAYYTLVSDTLSPVVYYTLVNIHTHISEGALKSNVIL